MIHEDSQAAAVAAQHVRLVAAAALERDDRREVQLHLRQVLVIIIRSRPRSPSARAVIARHVAARAVQLISLRGRQGPRTPRCSAKIGRASLDNLAALLTGLYAPDRAAGPTRWW